MVADGLNVVEALLTSRHADALDLLCFSPFVQCCVGNPKCLPNDGSFDIHDLTFDRLVPFLLSTMDVRFENPSASKCYVNYQIKSFT